MEARALRCPGCFAPIDPRHPVSKCRYCGTTIALHGSAVAPASAPGQLFLEHAGRTAITVIKVIREHTGLGLKEAKDLLDRAPCVVAEWDDPHRIDAFRKALIDAGARVR